MSVRAVVDGSVDGTMNGEEEVAGASSCNASGRSLTERLRRENSEQFLTLVRMHLSFLVDINTDDVDNSSDKPKQFRWGFNKKSKNTPSAPIAGAKCSESSITNEGISKVYELIDFLVKEDNVKQEGIFRRTGSLSRQQELKQLLMSGSSLGLDEGRFSVHDCASVLKSFLADLPQPLLMDQYYQTYCTLAVQFPANGDSPKGRLLTVLQLLLLLLSPLHRSLLQRLLTLLRLAADHESSNRMSPDTLATMFTPHLLCPRKLGPEALHSDAVALAPLVSFMIRQAGRLFLTPPQLATDVAAYYTIRERKRLMSPDGRLDESIGDRTAANTVYTFVDRPRTCAENEANPTDTALAQLYAHIQALPDSQHKRRLVKQFNRQNGYGTPIQIQRTGKAAGSKSLGESIKRHIFHKGLLNKTPKKGSSGTIVSISEKQATFSKETLRLPGEDSGKTVEVSHKNIVLKNLAQKMASAESLDDNEDVESDASNESTRSEGSLMDRVPKLSPKFVSEPNLSVLESRIDVDTPKNTRKGSRLFRSKVIASSQNLNKKYAPKKSITTRSTPTSCVSCVDECETSSDAESPDDLDNLAIESPAAIASVTPRLSRRDSMKHIQYRILAAPKDETNGHRSSILQYLTSTPGATVRAPVEESSTPYFNNFRRASMSPITKSTQKLSKAMQESIMTPRSRKPLIITSEQRDGSLTIETKSMEASESPDTIYGSISPKNDSDFVSSDDSCQPSYTKPSLYTNESCTKSSDVSISQLENARFSLKDIAKESLVKGCHENLCSSVEGTSALPQFKTSHEMSPLYLKECQTKSLTDPFREYLLSRSVLTATPVDLSLVNKSDEADRTVEGISESLMFCLDGNMPSDLTSSISNLVVDKEILTVTKNGESVRSPLKNLENCINFKEPSEGSSRKRTAAESDKNYCENELEVGSFKKVSVMKEKENIITEAKNIDNALWETDL